MALIFAFISSLSASFTKWLNTLKQFVGKLPTNCLRLFDHFVGLALKGWGITHLLGIDAIWQQIQWLAHTVWCYSSRSTWIAGLVISMGKSLQEWTKLICGVQSLNDLKWLLKGC